MRDIAHKTCDSHQKKKPTGEGRAAPSSSRERCRELWASLIPEPRRVTPLPLAPPDRNQLLPTPAADSTPRTPKWGSPGGVLWSWGFGLTSSAKRASPCRRPRLRRESQRCRRLSGWGGHSLALDSRNQKKMKNPPRNYRSRLRTLSTSRQTNSSAQKSSPSASVRPSRAAGAPRGKERAPQNAPSSYRLLLGAIYSVCQMRTREADTVYFKVFFLFFQ